MAIGESQWYRAIETWLKEVKGCTHIQSKFRFHGSNLLEGDVVGWVTARRDTSADFACELKNYPLPVGKDGYGSVGQALMLTRFSRHVYVGCTAAGGPGWKAVLEQHSTSRLLRSFGIPPAADYHGYLRVTTEIFRALFGGSGLGLIVVGTPEGGDGQVVRELIEPTPAR